MEHTTSARVWVSLAAFVTAMGAHALETTRYVLLTGDGKPGGEQVVERSDEPSRESERHGDGHQQGALRVHFVVPFLSRSTRDDRWRCPGKGLPVGPPCRRGRSASVRCFSGVRDGERNCAEHCQRATVVELPLWRPTTTVVVLDRLVLAPCHATHWLVDAGESVKT